MNELIERTRLINIIGTKENPKLPKSNSNSAFSYHFLFFDSFMSYSNFLSDIFLIFFLKIIIADIINAPMRIDT